MIERMRFAPQPFHNILKPSLGGLESAIPDRHGCMHGALETGRRHRFRQFRPLSLRQMLWCAKGHGRNPERLPESVDPRIMALGGGRTLETARHYQHGRSATTNGLGAQHLVNHRIDVRVSESVSADENRVCLISVVRQHAVEREERLFLQLIELEAAGDERCREDTLAVGCQADVFDVLPVFAVAGLAEIVMPHHFQSEVVMLLLATADANAMVNAAVKMI